MDAEPTHTGRVVAASQCLVLISWKLPTLLFNPSSAFLLRTLICFCLQILALFALTLASGVDDGKESKSYTQAELTEYEKRKGARDIAPDVKQIGLIAGVYTFMLPYLFPGRDEQPIISTLLRVTCFFYSCKILDLCVARANKSPQLTKGGSKVIQLSTCANQAKYMLRLWTETRYASFSSHSVNESRRSRTSSSQAWTWIPLLLIPTLAFVFPIAELKILLSLLAIQHGLETAHVLVHPRCPNPLFHQPFSATSLGTFWAIHWHQGAQPWLYNLAYAPTSHFIIQSLGYSKPVGQGLGVLATFSLSGIWHGWCAAALSTRPWAVGVGLWLVFLLQGIGCVLERSIFSQSRGSVLQRVSCWVFAVETAAIWLRFAEPTVKIA